jgi:putative ABC transport system permease protein
VSWFNRFSNLFRHNKVDEELEEELQFHLDARTRDNLKAGMNMEAAQHDARRRFGNATLAKERAHEMNIVMSIETIGRDLRYAFRSLRKSPGFTVVAILTLALGFGANTAVFTVVNGVLLRPLPFPEPGRLFLISYQSKQGMSENQPGLYDKDYLEYQRHNQAFEQIATFNEDSATLTGAGDAERVPTAMVTSSFFSVLQVSPAIGRAFLPQEERQGNNRLALLSDKIWRSRFGANPNILGKTITLDGAQYSVVGVMRAGFAFPHEAAVWLPLAVGADPGNTYSRPVLGRLRPSVSRQQALAELEAFAKHLPPGPGASRENMVAEILPLNDLLVAKVRKSLWIFMGAVAFVLLIACANVANLLLMRGATRQREIAVRNALGASRGRVLGQLLTESTLLSLSGSIAGILLATLGVRALLALAPAAGVPRLDEIHIDAGVLTFALVLGALMGILFGLVPALQATGERVRDFLSLSGPLVTAGRQRLRGALVVSEIALALVLLTGAGLMLKSFMRMRTVDPGFRTQSILTMTVDLPDSTYPTTPAIQAFHTQILEKLTNLPAIIAAGAVNWMPLQPVLVRGDFHLEGGRRLPRGYIVAKPAVSPHYFSVMGIRLLQGRGFTEQDNSSAPGVAIVSQSVVNTLWPGEEPIGKRITLEDNAKPQDWLTIVGVVDDIRQQSLAEQPQPAIYQPLQQVTRPFFLSHMSYVVRTVQKPQSVAAALRGVLHQVDTGQPVEIAALTDLVDANVAEIWFQTRLISIFSILALFLAGIGIYGVLAYAVTERTREIGIRMALGAKKSDVTRMLLKRTLLLVMAGVAFGGCGALVLTRVLAKFLFEVKPTDPATFLSVAAILALTGIIAGLLPAQRATRVDPVVALRWE